MRRNFSFEKPLFSCLEMLLEERNNPPLNIVFAKGGGEMNLPLEDMHFSKNVEMFI